MEQRNNTKERLLKAAIKEFALKGYKATTVRAICTRAGANVASVNYHYGDKQRLYGEVFHHIFKMCAQARLPYLPEDAPAKERLRQFIRSFFHEVFSPCSNEDDCGDIGAIYIMEMAHPTDVLDEVVTQYIVPQADELRKIIANYLGTEPTEDDMAKFTASIIGQILYYCTTMPVFERLNPQFDTFHDRLEEFADHVFEFTVGGLNRMRDLHQAE